MKLVINYDFVNALKDVKEPIGPFKIIRNNKFTYTINGPICFIIGNKLGYDIQETLQIIMMAYGLAITNALLSLYITKKITKSDLDSYGLRAKKRLMRLTKRLESINVKTTYDMLLQSEVYDKRIKIDLNESKIPLLMQEKYVFVPAYGFDGKEKEISLLQEHEIGSRTYLLSVGEPEKQYRRVLVNA